jgi:hypothetical protein
VGSAASTDDWTFISRTKQYSPTAADVGHQLSVRCVSTDRTNACEKTVKTNTVLPQPGPPPPRVLTHARPNPRAKGLPLRVVSFNVLAEIYATKQQYPDCPMWALTWNYRKKNLLREIRQFDGDIISLQEVQADRFEDFFLPEMRKLGYEGLYKKKTRESMGREGKVDGCALFYRTSALKLLEKCVNRASCTSPFFPPSPCRLPERSQNVALPLPPRAPSPPPYFAPASLRSRRLRSAAGESLLPTARAKRACQGSAPRGRTRSIDGLPERSCLPPPPLTHIFHSPPLALSRSLSLSLSRSLSPPPPMSCSLSLSPSTEGT